MRMSGPWVLYVEDSEHDREAFARALAAPGVRGVDLVLAASAQEARGLIARRAGAPALVLIDVRLPDADGFEVLRKVQRAWPGRIAPAVMISALGEPELAEACLLAGAHSVLEKPVSAAEAGRQFAEAVRFWIGPPRRTRPRGRSARGPRRFVIPPTGYASRRGRGRRPGAEPQTKTTGELRHHLRVFHGEVDRGAGASGHRVTTEAASVIHGRDHHRESLAGRVRLQPAGELRRGLAPEPQTLEHERRRAEALHLALCVVPAAGPNSPRPAGAPQRPLPDAGGVVVHVHDADAVPKARGGSPTYGPVPGAATGCAPPDVCCVTKVHDTPAGVALGTTPVGRRPTWCGCVRSRDSLTARPLGPPPSCAGYRLWSNALSARTRHCPPLGRSRVP